MEFRMRILSEADIERVEDQALRVLHQVGVRLDNDALCAELAAKGALVDGRQVRYPPQLVRWALEKAPKEVILWGRNGQQLPLRHSFCHISSYTDAVNVSAYGADRLHPSTHQDVIDFVRLAQAMPEISIVGPICYARDLPQPVQLLRSAEVVVRYSNKHINVGPLNLEEAHTWCDLVEIAAPGVELGRTPIISFVVSPTSPLQLDHDSSLVLQYAAARRIPFIAASCPMAGGTSPMALVGTIVLHLAEDLFLITTSQLLNEGTPVIMGGAAGVLDVRSGALSYGAPERHLLLGALIELAGHYGLPHHSPAGSVDSWLPDAQTAAEKMQCWMTRLAKDIVFGIFFGSLYNGQAVSLEQMVIDADLWHMAVRVFKGLDTSELENAFDVIQRVGPGGNFLSDEQTFRLMRSQEMYYSDIGNREGDRGRSMLERAHAKVERLLGEEGYAPPEATTADIERYANEQAARLTAAIATQSTARG